LKYHLETGGGTEDSKGVELGWPGKEVISFFMNAGRRGGKREKKV